MTRQPTRVPSIIAVLTVVALLLGHTLTPVAYSHAAPDDPIVCDIEPGRGSPGRALILIQGMLSRSKSEPMWDSLTNELSELYGGFIYFSYSGRPHDYGANDTMKSITGHDLPLLRQLIVSCNRQGWTSFDIIGHSKGGTLAIEYIKAYGLAGSDEGLVRHVVTLDAPVNGSELAWLLLRSLGSADPAPWWGAHLAGGETTAELAQMYEDRVTVRRLNIQAALERERMGSCVLTISNNQDLAISQADALIDGFGKSYDLGANLRADLGRRLGHHCTLDVPNQTSELEDIRDCFSGRSSPGRFSPQPLPGLSESLKSFISDATQRSLLFLSQLWHGAVAPSAAPAAVVMLSTL